MSVHPIGERAAPPPAAVRPPRRLRRRIVLAIAATVAFVLLLGLTGRGVVRRWARQALPEIDGQVSLAGLSAPVTVRRDRLGVPHVEAATRLDLFRAQGYVTAQDRLWQMDLLRRRAMGELAEAFGEAALPADQEIRTLNLRWAAQQSLPRLDPDLRAVLEAYAAGVNAYIDTHRDALPVEFRLLRYEPRAWTPVDTLAVGKLLSYDLANGWELEAIRAALSRRLGKDVLQLLYPKRFPEDRLLTGSDAGEPRGSGAEADTVRGSNNWVVSGAHTATGKPLLANDPHLALGVPSIWAAVHLTAPGLDVLGMSLPGTPGVLIGRNQDVAWGCTNVHDDSADLYVEEFQPDHPDRYRVGQDWETVGLREEAIRVRVAPLASSWRTVSQVVRTTRHGPLVELAGQTYALRWTSLEFPDDISSFLRMDEARSWEEFQDGLRLFPGPSQNFVYADSQGHVAWYSAGRLPIRRSGDGSMPYRGATEEGDWLSYVPFETLPHVVDPPSGRLATANNRLVGSDYPYTVTRGGIPPWRAAVILSALEARDGWTADDMARLQGERLSLPHRDLARALLAAATRHRGDPVWEDVARELGGWDGRLEPTSRAAALAVLTFRSLGERVIGPRVAGTLWADSLQHRAAAIQTLVRDRPASWLPKGDADWDATFAAAWRAAVSDLEQRLGRDRRAWHWGALNRMAVHHPLTRAASVFGRFFDPPVLEMGGASSTVNVLSVTPSGAVEGPSMRFVADLADPDNTRLTNFLGQSGNPVSEHYQDQLQAWVRAEPQRVAFTPAAVARETQHTLRLVPASTPAAPGAGR